jgi:hypothetical protein
LAALNKAEESFKGEMDARLASLVVAARCAANTAEEEAEGDQNNAKNGEAEEINSDDKDPLQSQPVDFSKDRERKLVKDGGPSSPLLFVDDEN